MSKKKNNKQRCVISGKLVDNREVVLVEYAELYVEKQAKHELKTKAYGMMSLLYICTGYIIVVIL